MTGDARPAQHANDVCGPQISDTNSVETLVALNGAFVHSQFGFLMTFQFQGLTS